MAASSAKFLGLLKVLTAHDVDFVIVGGVAGVLAGAPLLTLDLDVVFDPALDNLPRLLAALQELDARYRDPAGRHIVPTLDKLRTLRMNLLTTRLGDLDVLRSIGRDLRYPDLLERCHEYRLSDLHVRAIDLPTLIEAKEIADRPTSATAALGQPTRSASRSIGV